MSGYLRRASSLAAIAVLILGVVATVSFISERSDSGSQLGTRISDPTSISSGMGTDLRPTTTNMPPRKETTEFIYAVRDSTKVVKVSLRDGSFTVVADAKDAIGGKTIQSIAATPSGRIYFSWNTGCHEGATYWILDPENSYVPEGPFPGGSPRPSPDGTRLAVSFAGPEISGASPGDLGATGCQGILITEIGQPREDEAVEEGGLKIAMPGAGTYESIGPISDIIWTPDGSALLMEQTYEGTGYQAFSAVDGRMLWDVLPGTIDGGFVATPRFFFDGTVLVVFVCNQDTSCVDPKTLTLRHYDVSKSKILSSWDTPRLGEVIVEPGGSRIVYTIDNGLGASSLVLIDEKGTEHVLGTGFSPTAITW